MEIMVELTSADIAAPPMGPPERAVQAWSSNGMNCGPVALAAAVWGLPLSMSSFAALRIGDGDTEASGSAWPGYTNKTTMIDAIRRLGRSPRRVPGAELQVDEVARAVVFVKFLPPKGETWGCWQVECQHTHWIAIRKGLVFDVNLPRWTSLETWDRTVPEDLGYEYGYEIDCAYLIE